MALLGISSSSYACSPSGDIRPLYLPGKANLHFVFWAALFASITEAGGRLRAHAA
jgi:hypothetical protein